MSFEIPASPSVLRDLVNSAPDREIRELTRAMCRGCDQSWNCFYQDYRGRLWGYLAVCWKGQNEAVDDLLQDTLLRAVRHMRVFESEDALWSWLTVLAKSAVADHGRKAGRFRRFLQMFVPEKVDQAVPDEVLKEARDQLTAANQQLLIWKYDESRSIAEISKKLQISEKAVESRLTRARAALKKKYQRLS